MHEVEENKRIDDIAPLKTVKINGKTFNYYIYEDNDETEQNYAILDYFTTVSGKLLVLEVELTGRGTYDDKGNLISETAPINVDVLKTKELASILNFKISK